MTKSSLGKFIKKMRGDDTQIVFAKSCGITREFLSEVENGRSGISGELASKMKSALKLSESQGSELQREAARHAGFRV